MALSDNKEKIRTILNKINNLPNAGGGNATWAGLPDKPVVMAGGDTLTWDGNTEGLEFTDLFDMPMYRVSDVVLTPTDFTNGYQVKVNDGNTFEVTDPPKYMEGVVLAIFDGVMSIGPGFESEGLYPGVYFGNASGEYISSLAIPGYTGFAQEKIAPSHLWQPDWNQNDSSKPDFIKNRPFYSEVVMTEIIPETEIVGEDAGSGAFVYTGLHVVEEAGNATITFDGTKYNLSPVEDEGGIFAYGNIDLGSGVSDIPFVLMVLPGKLSAIAMLDGDAHTVSITMEVPQNKIIDEKYIPVNEFYVNFAEFAASGVNAARYLYTDSTCTSKATSADIDALVESNAEIIIRVQNVLDIDGFVIAGTVMRCSTLMVLPSFIDGTDYSMLIVPSGYTATADGKSWQVTAVTLFTAEYTG